MVWVATPGAGGAYEVYDPGGRLLGRVVDPAGDPRVGPGEATILLRRRPEDRAPRC